MFQICTSKYFNFCTIFHRRFFSATWNHTPFRTDEQGKTNKTSPFWLMYDSEHCFSCFAKSQLETHAISPRFCKELPLGGTIFSSSWKFLHIQFKLYYTSIKTDNLIIIHICLPLKIKILKTDLLVWVSKIQLLLWNVNTENNQN